MKLDTLNRRILHELDINSRLPLTRIAKNVRSSKEKVNFRIKNMVNDGDIREMYSIIDASKLGYSYYQIFIKLHRATNIIEDKIMNFLRTKENIYCISLRMCQGPYDITFLCVVKDAADLRKFLSVLKKKFGNYILEKDIHVISRIHKLNKKFLYPGTPVKFSFGTDKPEKRHIDKLDKKILQNISSHSRIKLIELAKKIKTDPKVVKYRIKRLEKDGIIVLYTCAIGYEKMGLERVQINISIKDFGAIPSIIQFFDQLNICSFVAELLGKYDLSLEIYIKDDFELRDILSKFKQLYGDIYNYFDVFHVFREYVTDWSPY
jgi:DNA-binding Lrp family transcriptional regulator